MAKVDNIGINQTIIQGHDIDNLSQSIKSDMPASNQVSIQQTLPDKKKDSLREYLTPTIEYKLYKRRWLILLYFALAEFCSTFVYPCFSPIAIQVGEIFNEDASVVTLTATLYLLMHPIVTFPASYLIINKGPAYSVNLGSVFTILGSLVRVLSCKYSFVWLLVGQTLAGIGRPLILNAQANITQNWFPIKSRTGIITLLNSLITVSGIIGIVIPSIFFGGYNQENGKHKFNFLVCFEAALCSLFLIPSFFIMRSNPKTPPSAFANMSEKVNFISSVKQIFSDKKFILLMLSFAFFNGTFKGFGVVLAYLVQPFGYGPSSIAIFAVSPVIGGVASAVFAPIIYRKIGKFKPIIIMMQFLTICGFFLFYYGCYLRKLYLIVPFCIVGFIQQFLQFNGAALMPCVPFLLEWSCKQTYPINDSFSIGILYSGATLFSSFIGEILVFVIEGGDEITKWSSLYGILTINALYLVAIVLLLFVRESKHRAFISFAQSFHSVKVFRTPTEQSVSDLFKLFPSANPDGNLSFNFGNDGQEEFLDEINQEYDQREKIDEPQID